MSGSNDPRSLVDFQPERYRPSADLITREAVDELKHVLELQPIERTEALLHRADGVALLLKFFKDVPRPQRLSILRVSRYQHFEGSTIVFSQGDEGNHFYIVLRGQVAVIKNEAFYEREVQVATLFSGMGFGELALHCETGRRSATIAALTDCEFLVLDREGYQNAVKKWAQEKLEMRARFLKTIYFFGHWPWRKLQNLAKLLISKSYAPGAVIVTEGTYSDEVYLIVAGECKLIKRAKLRGQRLMLDIGVLGASDYFGEWGLQTAATKPRACSVVAVGNVEVLVLNRYDFEEHVSTDARSVASINLFASEHYKSESALLSMFERCYLWDSYKSAMVTQIIGQERTEKRARSHSTTSASPPSGACAPSRRHNHKPNSPRAGRLKRHAAAVKGGRGTNSRAAPQADCDGSGHKKAANSAPSDRTHPMPQVEAHRRLLGGVKHIGSARSMLRSSARPHTPRDVDVAHISKGAKEQAIDADALPQLPSLRQRRSSIILDYDPEQSHENHGIILL